MSDFLFADVSDDELRSIDFTRKAENRIHKVVTSSQFRDMDVDSICQFLFSEFDSVSFQSYLKRYIYLKAEIVDHFKAVPDEVYHQIISDSFANNQAPRSFEPTTVRWNKTIDRWLSQDNVQRDTVFLLGFGLRMTASAVSEFLTKVVKEADFDFYDPREAVFWYCFRNDLRYAAGNRFLGMYALKIPESSVVRESSYFPEKESEYLSQLQSAPTEEHLLLWLGWLRTNEVSQKRKDNRWKCFQNLYRECQKLVVELDRVDWATRGQELRNPSEVTPSEIESILYDGTPRDKNRNLKKMNQSLFYRRLAHQRLTRQRLDQILAGTTEITRFDLITLLFFISSQSEEENPQRRCMQFIDEANRVLDQCSMLRIYPANEYDAFVLLCLLSEDPLPMFCDVWEKSYQNSEAG